MRSSALSLLTRPRAMAECLPTFPKELEEPEIDHMRRLSLSDQDDLDQETESALTMRPPPPHPLPTKSSLTRDEEIEQSLARLKDQGKYVKLNVGGSLHFTTVGTLTKRDNMLRAMFSGRLELQTDDEGACVRREGGREGWE